MSKKQIKEKVSKKATVTKLKPVPKSKKEKPATVPSSTKKKVAIKKTAEKKSPLKKGVKLSKEASEKLLDAVIEGIKEKKGEQIVCLDLRKVNASVCDYFVICQANSRTQVDSIARSVENTVKILTKERPFHSEGYQNSEWILIDYINVVVHIFQPEIRDFYRLEDLWADAQVKKF